MASLLRPPNSENLMRLLFCAVLLFAACSQRLTPDPSPTPHSASSLAAASPASASHLDPIRMPCDAASMALLSYQQEAAALCSDSPGSCARAMEDRNAKSCLVFHRCEEALKGLEQRERLRELEDAGLTCP